jgi:hypothetical protein
MTRHHSRVSTDQNGLDSLNTGESGQLILDPYSEWNLTKSRRLIFLKQLNKLATALMERQRENFMEKMRLRTRERYPNLGKNFGGEEKKEKEKKENKERLAQIHYVELGDGKIKIVALKNFYTPIEIEQKFGSEVSKEYFTNIHSMTRKTETVLSWRGADAGLPEHVVFTRDDVPKMFNGVIYERSCFVRIEEEARLCGQTLSAINKEFKKNKKRVHISYI